MHLPVIKRIFIPLLLMVLAAGSLGGCRNNSEGTTSPTQTVETPGFSETPEPTPTITPTPEPAALIVNGESIPLTEYNAQLIQLQAADLTLGKTRSPEEQRQMVLDELIDQTLLAQAAVENGFEMGDEDLSSRLEALAAEKGGQAALDEWMTANGYTLPGLRSALRRASASAFQRDIVTGTVPETADQVHAQQILVRFDTTAQTALGQLQAGSDFATLAAQYDPITGGILGWFPRGYLTQLAVEEAAFSLEPGQYSGIIQSDIGFHIIYIIERDPNRPLSVDARVTLQQKVLMAWLEAQLEASTIDVVVP